MKVTSGQESYQHDEDSHIRPLKQHWWEELNHAIQSEVTILIHKSHFLLASVLKLLDWIIRTIALSGAHYFLIKKNKEEILSHRPQWEFYKNIALEHDANKVFLPPPEIRHEEIIKAEKKNIPDGTIYQCQMPNKFTPLNPFFKESYWQYHKHRNIDFELWQHDDESPRPTYVFMHGYNADDFRINHLIFSAKKVFKDGANIAFLVLPFHTGKFKLSTDIWNFFGHGPAYTTEVFANAVSNCRSVISYLLDEGIASKIGISGISLGGFVSSLVLSVDERVNTAVLLAPVYNVPESYMEWFPLKQLFTKLLAEENIPFNEFRHSYALCNALTYNNIPKTEHITILSGIFDLIALPKHVRLLGEHWGQCDIHWLEYGHVGMTSPHPFYKHIKEHNDKVGFFNEMTTQQESLSA